MSDTSSGMPSEIGEVVSTPGGEIFLQNHGSPVPQASPSERKQARRENWRLIRRRPAFIIGVAIVVFWVVCALFGSRFAPHNPLDFRVKPHLSPSGK